MCNCFSTNIDPLDRLRPFLSIGRLLAADIIPPAAGVTASGSSSQQAAPTRLMPELVSRLPDVRF